MSRDLKQTTLVWCLLVSGLLATTSAQNADPFTRFIRNMAAPLRVVGDGDPPNILFIIVDDLNTALGSYAETNNRPHYATVNTPNLDRLASEGILFTNAFAQNPLCNPSRASLLSGLRPNTVDVHDTTTWPRHKIGDALRMLPEHFDDHGYFTARDNKTCWILVEIPSFFGYAFVLLGAPGDTCKCSPGP